MKLKFNHVDFFYGDKAPNLFQALNDIDCEIKEHSFTCIVGHTGCGKSTLIQQSNGDFLKKDSFKPTLIRFS